MSNEKPSVISHENANTAIASLGLVIALITAWHQFGPAHDDLELESGGRVEIGVPFTKGRLFPPISEKTQHHLAGPVFWRLVLYNPLDRAVSVLEIDTFMSNSDGLMQYTDLDAGLLESGASRSPVSLPLSIEPRHAEAIILGLNIPVAAEAKAEISVAEESAEESCYQPESLLRDVETCLFSRARDLFGNPVDYSEHPRAEGRPAISVSWPKGMNSPTFIAVVRTGDGSEFTAPVHYYPQL